MALLTLIRIHIKDTVIGFIDKMVDRRLAQLREKAQHQ